VSVAVEHKKEIVALTGMRGLGAVFVALYHYLPGLFSSGRAGIFFHHGYLSVDMFFVLSGYVMSRVHDRDFAGSVSAAGYARFLCKRLARIYPLYAAIVALCIVAAGFALLPMPQGHPVRVIVVNILLLQGWGLAVGLAGPTWSISTEFSVYLLFPFMVRVVSSRRLVALVTLMLVSTVLLVTVAGLPDEQVGEVGRRNGLLDVFSSHSAYPILRCLAGFMLGVASYYLGTAQIVRRVQRFSVAGDLVVAAIIALLCVRNSDVAVVLLLVPLMIFMTDGNALSRKALELRVVRWLGTVSYSIYLLHGVVNGLCRPTMQSALQRVGVPHTFTLSGFMLLALTLTMAAVTYYGIERPSQRVLRRLVAQRERPAVAPC